MLDMEKVKPIKKWIASLWAWMIVSPIRFFIVAIAIFFPLIVALDWFWFKDWDDLKNVLVEAHGLLFDLIVFGIILVSYEYYRQLHENAKKEETEKQQRIERYKEEIDDLRRWDEKEAMFRIVGCIKRLTKEGVSEINLSYCNLEYANLAGINLSGANLSGARLNYCNLTATDLTKANLTGTSMFKADLTRTILSKAYLINTYLREAKLDETIFSNAFMGGVNFCKVYILKSDFSGADIVSEFKELAKGYVNPEEKIVGIDMQGAFIYESIFTDFKELTFEILSSLSGIKNAVDLPETLIQQLRLEKPEILGEGKNALS